MVEESKNERLTTLLAKTNELLVGLGAAVQRQKDAEHADNGKMIKQGIIEHIEEEDEEALADIDGDHLSTKPDLLEGQRQYNSVIHSIQEKVCYNHILKLNSPLKLLLKCKQEFSINVKILEISCISCLQLTHSQIVEISVISF